MPNGGSDCCATCWFNSKNDGVPGYHGSKKEGEVLCTIRNLEIPHPFDTYCANHPRHNKEKIILAIGPVYIDAGGFPYRRKVWIDPPDNEEIRPKLLELLSNIKNERECGCPVLDRAVITHLAAIKEKNAVTELKRIVNLDIEDHRTVALAIEALLEITDGEAIDDVKHFINKGIEDGTLDNYSQENDDYAVIRYYLVKGLKFSRSKTDNELLETATRDPHSEIKAYANEIHATKNEC